MVTEGQADWGNQNYYSFVCDLHFFNWSLKGPALDSIRRLKANIVLSDQGLGWELFSFTSALIRRFAVRPGCYCSLLEDLSVFLAQDLLTSCSVLFQINTSVSCVGEKVSLHKSLWPVFCSYNEIRHIWHIPHNILVVLSLGRLDLNLLNNSAEKEVKCSLLKASFLLFFFV